MRLNIVKFPRKRVQCFEFLYKSASWFKEIPGSKVFFMNKPAARMSGLFLVPALAAAVVAEILVRIGVL